MAKDKIEKKRKRDDETANEASKKAKKSRKSEDYQNATPMEAPMIERKKDKKDKKEKKDKEQKKSDQAEHPGQSGEASAADQKPAVEKVKKSKKGKKVKAVSNDVQDGATPFTEGKSQDNSPDETQNFIRLDDDAPMPGASAASEKVKNKKKEKKKPKKEQKPRKYDQETDRGAHDQGDNIEETALPKGASEEAIPSTSGVDEKTKKAKKDGKTKKHKKEKREVVGGKKAAQVETSDEPVKDVAQDTQAGDGASDEQEAVNGANHNGTDCFEQKKGRFIVFVGNLPFSATKEQIEEHFAKVKPTEIRLRTYKDSGKFMGTCFVEFDRFDRMETCLKKYHHSLFPDSKRKEGRKINVELSAGGGGNSEVRRTRIQAKNDKLHDERARDREKRAELQIKQDERKEKKDAREKKGDKVGKVDASEDAAAEPESNGIHPSRLAMMNSFERPNHRQRY